MRPTRLPGAALRAIAWLACLGTLLVPTVAAAGTGWTHSLRLADGGVYGRRLFYSQRMLVGVASLNGEIARAITLDLSFRKVGDAPGGGTTVSASYDFLHYSEDGIAGRSAYSSREGGPVPAAIRDLAPLVGRSFLIRTDGRGRIVEIQGTDAVSAAAILSFFPEGPVVPGDTWPWTLSFPGDPPTVLASTLRLEQADAGGATLGVRSVLKPGSQAAAAPDNGLVALGLGLSGTQEGEIVVDGATGLPAKGSLRQHFSGTLRIATGTRLRLPSGQLSVPMSGEGLLTLSSY